MQQMDSLTNCFETETGLNAPNSPHDHDGPSQL